MLLITCSHRTGGAHQIAYSPVIGRYYFSMCRHCIKDIIKCLVGERFSNRMSQDLPVDGRTQSVDVDEDELLDDGDTFGG